MNSVPHPAEASVAPPKSAIARKWLIAILVLTFAFVLMPFLLWYMTTFTRPLSDADLAENFADLAHPRKAQHALSQIADRMMSPNPALRESAKIWYPKVVEYSAQGSVELRVTAAWVMGQDNQVPEFHAALLKQLAESDVMVKRNAALSLVRFADPSGHDTIAAMLSPYVMVSPRSGIQEIRLKPGDVINPGTLLAHIVVSGEKTEVRSEVPGSILEWTSPDNVQLEAGHPMLLVSPSPEMAWESLRALFLVGRKEDLPLIDRYARGVDGMPPQVAQQAALTAKEISARKDK